jgi:hypothetical protein
MRILILYNAGQTYTETVLEHLDSFRNFSAHEWHYLHYRLFSKELHTLNSYQAIFLHYSVRLPFDQINESMAKVLSEFQGLKGLFIQDEYDNVSRTKYWLNKIGFDIVFSAVPQKSINEVYPSSEFSHTRFVNNLTGYAPSGLNSLLNSNAVLPPSKRDIVIGYRGRKLPIRYGKLGQEKISIGKDVKKFCKFHKINHDIEWDEDSRIYGKSWYKFLFSCKAMLGSESGSNVFDFQGDLSKIIKKFKKSHLFQTEDNIYRTIVKPLERDGLMNQVSPRIFEMAASNTIMILYEGSYSDIIKPNSHYLPLKKDLSNLPEIVEVLKNDSFIDAMALRVRSEIIDSGNFGYQSFINLVDKELDELVNSNNDSLQYSNLEPGGSITTLPIVAKPPLFFGFNKWPLKGVKIMFDLIKDLLPPSVKEFIKRLLGRA